MSVNKFAEIRNAETGEVLCQMIGPPNARTSGDLLSESLYALSEIVTRGLKPEARFGGLGGEFGYACEFENDVFEFHPDYQHCSCPESDHGWFQDHVNDCVIVANKPNFRHKPSGFEVRWYKWIGRDMELSREVTGEEWLTIWNNCIESLPKDAVEKALTESKADAEREADPEYQRQQQEARSRLSTAMDSIWKKCETEGHDDTTGHCKRCGLITNIEKWGSGKQ